MKTLLLIAFSTYVFPYTTALAQGVLQRPAQTPGAVLTVDKATVCKAGYTATVRNVSEATKLAVFQSYGIHCSECGRLYEVDHLISLELGGSNDIKNLWPQSYLPKPGAREKDTLEDALHADVCAGRISLVSAQKLISHDWYAEYRKRFQAKR